MKGQEVDQTEVLPERQRSPEQDCRAKAHLPLRRELTMGEGGNTSVAESQRTSFNARPPGYHGLHTCRLLNTSCRASR